MTKARRKRLSPVISLSEEADSICQAPLVAASSQRRSNSLTKVDWIIVGISLLTNLLLRTEY